MAKNPEWNSAVENSILERDWNVACKSEVFSNFAKLFINKQGAFAEDEEEAIEEGVDLPLKMNEDYDGDYLDKLISEAQVEIDEVGDMVEEEIDTDSDGFIDDEFGLEPVDSVDVSDEYNTGAGESNFIDIGLTDETMNDIKNDGVMSSAVKEIMDVYKEEELADAEKDLGLDINAAYIFGKGRG